MKPQCEYQNRCAYFERHGKDCPKYADMCSIAQEERKNHTKTLDKKIGETDAYVVELENECERLRRKLE